MVRETFDSPFFVVFFFFDEDFSAIFFIGFGGGTMLSGLTIFGAEESVSH
jgi:hypothetical protein